MGLLPLLLDLSENWFDRSILNHINVMQVNFYPELVKEYLANQLRASAHSDYGSLSLLLEDEGELGLDP